MDLVALRRCPWCVRKGWLTMPVPQSLMDEIRRYLGAGMTPAQVADALGRRAKLDHSEIVSLRGIAEAVRTDMIDAHGIPA